VNTRMNLSFQWIMTLEESQNFCLCSQPQELWVCVLNGYVTIRHRKAGTCGENWIDASPARKRLLLNFAAERIVERLRLT
jgi:hypothetical protein